MQRILIDLSEQNGWRQDKCKLNYIYISALREPKHMFCIWQWES